MKRDIGSSAGLLAILALLAHTVFPGLQESRTSSSDRKGESAKSSDSGASQEAPREGPWLATRAYFQGPRAELPKNDVELNRYLEGLFTPDHRDLSPLRKLFALDDRTAVYTVVATVADPARTHLSLFFDGQIDAILGGTSRQGWTFAQQWLPWTDVGAASPDGISKRRTERRLESEQEELPGILVFRHEHEQEDKDKYGLNGATLLVFLVPETPAGGIAGAPFFAAINLASELNTGKRREVGLLGPSFSGSFPSLTELVKQWTANSQKANVHSPVFGGSVSSRDYAREFTTGTKLTFHSGIVSSSDYQEKILEDVKARYALDAGEIAFLVEEESGYGQAVNAGLTNVNASPTVYRFPRDIARLRNAYPDAPAANTAGKDRALPSQASIDFTVKDNSGAEESVPAMSKSLWALSQSAVVNAELEDIKRRRIRLVSVSATNPLDEIFLAQLIRRQCPNTRVLLSNADLLFVPAAEQDALAGTLLLSTYPMSFQGDTWLTQEPAFRVSQTSNVLGLANVAQLLLGQMTDDNRPLRSYQGYTSASSNAQVPGLWLLEVTRFGLLPIDWFRVDNAGGAENVQWLLNSPEQAPAGQFFLPDPPIAWYVIAFCLSLVIVVGLVVLVRSNLPETQAGLTWLNLTDNCETRCPALFGLFLLLASMEWVLFVPAIHATGGAWLTSTLALTLLGLTAALFCSGFIAWRFKGEAELRFRCVFFSLSYSVLFLLMCGLWWLSCGGLTESPDAKYLFFRLRALELYSGASPLLPVLIIIGMFAAGFAIYFYRYTQWGKTRPRLLLDWSPKLACTRVFAKNIDEFIGAPVRLSRPLLLRRRGMAVLIMIVCLILLTGHMNSVDHMWPYNCLLYTAMGVIVLALAEAYFDLIHLWLNLQGLLKVIEVLPLRSAFNRVARLAPPRTLRTFWRMMSPQTFFKHLERALQNRVSVAGTEAPSATADLNSIQAIGEKCYLDTSIPRQERLANEEAFQKEIAGASAQMLDRLVITWQNRMPDEEGEQDASSPVRFARYSSDFVALHLSSYMIHVARQIQVIAWSASLLLLMLIVVLTSYSTQSPLLLARFVAGAFIVAGCLVAWVLGGMERNTVLSQIQGTRPGTLGVEYWLQLLSIGLLPLIGVLAHLFPDAATFLSSWVVPSVQSLN